MCFRFRKHFLVVQLPSSSPSSSSFLSSVISFPKFPLFLCFINDGTRMNFLLAIATSLGVEWTLSDEKILNSARPTGIVSGQIFPKAATSAKPPTASDMPGQCTVMAACQRDWTRNKNNMHKAKSSSSPMDNPKLETKVAVKASRCFVHASKSRNGRSQRPSWSNAEAQFTRAYSRSFVHDSIEA